MLVIDGVRYKLWTPKDEEKEFHPLIKEHSKEIFGEDSLYFDVKHKLISRSGIGSIPDAYVISLSKPYDWYIVEIELASHRVYEHIVPQISKFISGIENLRSQREVRDVLYKEITQDKVLKACVQKMIHPEEIHRFLSSLVSKSPRIAIIIDEVTDEVREASKALKKLGETEVVEFKTFVREDAPNVHAHLFEPISGPTKISPPIKKVEERKLPEHYESWEKMLAWVNDNTKDVVKELTKSILKLGEVTHSPLGRYYCFYRGKRSTKSRFVCFNLTKKALKVRIRTEPRTFKDTQKWTGDKIYKGWFFHHGLGQEREFKVTNKEQIDYAMELIKQSYELAK
jgi:predicted transport protein